MIAFIPSPASNGVRLGPLFFHFYGVCYVVGIALAIRCTRRLWARHGGDPDLVYEVAAWGVPAGIFGGRLYHDITSRNTVPHAWWGWLAVWQGGLGIWGGIAGGFLGALIPLRKHRVSLLAFMDAVAPGLLIAQAVGYSAFRIFEERLRVDPAHHILGERLNFWVASLLAALAAAWFVRIQLRAGEVPPPQAERQRGPRCQTR